MKSRAESVEVEQDVAYHLASFGVDRNHKVSSDVTIPVLSCGDRSHAMQLVKDVLTTGEHRAIGGDGEGSFQTELVFGLCQESFQFDE